MSATDLLRHIWDHPGNEGHRLRAVGRCLAWQVWERTVKRPVKVPIGAGLIYCYPHSTAASSVLYTRLPDFGELTFLQRWLKPGELFLDVGANVGTWSMLAASLGVQVIAYEPSSDTFPLLVENIGLNRWEDRIRPVKAAVGRSHGEARLTTGLGTVNRLVDEGGEAIPVVTLDGPERVSLVKIDVEGAELDVLEGARRMIERDQPALIVEANDPDALARFFKEIDYTAVRHDDGTIRPSYIQGANVIAIADFDSARIRIA